MTSPTISMTNVGAGSRILILHGLLGAGRNWGGIVRDLSPDHQVFTLDLPNHGGSGWIDRMDYPTQARIIADQIRAIGAPVILLGHSMGGKIAMTVALTAPDLVQSLIVADIAPVTYDHDFGAFTRAMKKVPLDQMASRAQIEAHLAQDIQDPRVRAFLLQNLESTDNGFRWRSNLDVIERSQDEILGFPVFAPGAVFTGPALFISGELSDYVTPDYHQATRKLFPNAQFRTVPQAGHWLHADQPQAFIAGIRAFLAG